MTANSLTIAQLKDLIKQWGGPAMLAKAKKVQTCGYRASSLLVCIPSAVPVQSATLANVFET